MTDAQKFKFFMPAWTACCKANGWHTRDYTAVIDASRLNEEGRQMFALARQRSLAAKRGMTLSDLRHACYIVCLTRDKATSALNNSEQDHIVALFNVLKDPLSLAARAVWEAYQRGENPGNKNRRKYFIKSRAPEGVLRHLTADLTQNQTKEWESLDDNGQKNLARLLAQRRIYGRPEAMVQGPKSKVQSQRPDAGGSPGGAQSKAPSPKNYVLNPQLVFTKGPF
jgi:hypothetical protein